MSVLTCPVCQGAMQELNREGILIDTCTQCRGVWLDRGELEKLLSMARSEYGAPAPAHHAPAPQAPQHRAPPPPPRYDDHHYDNRDNRRDHDDDRHRYRKKSKLESIFDIFD